MVGRPIAMEAIVDSSKTHSTQKIGLLHTLYAVGICFAALLALASCQKPAGGKCDKNGDCEDRLACVDGTCMSLKAEGASCDKDAHCKEGLTCLEQRCFARRGERGDCESGPQCKEGLICHGGACKSEAAIARSEKERAVRSKQALRDLFSDGFSKEISVLAAATDGPAAHAACQAVVDAVAGDQFDSVPARVAEAGVHLTQLLSAAAATQPRLTDEMKAAMAGHDAATYATLQEQQRANGKLLKALKGLATVTTRGMAACLQTGPPAARSAALKDAVALRDGARKRATGAAAKAFAEGVARLVLQTAKEEPDDDTRDNMQALAAAKTTQP